MNPSDDFASVLSFPPHFVTPANAGVQSEYPLDSRFRGNDKLDMSAQRYLLPFFLIILLFPGCYKVTPAVKTLPEAYNKFIATCKEDYSLDVQIKPAGKTVFIYLPIDHSILEFKAKTVTDMLEHPQDPQEKDTLNFISSKYENQNLSVDYSVTPQKMYPKEETGYTYGYNEEFQEKQSNIVTAFYRSFGDLDVVPGDVVYKDKEKQASHKALVDAYELTDAPPDFIVLIITDVKKGVEVEAVVSFSDLKRTMIGELPADEYQKRVLYEVRGSPEALDDWSGNHINVKEMTWPEFISRQIKNRIQYEYTRLKPSAPTHEEILAIIAETARYYDFIDFNAIYLHDLESDTKYQFSQEQLKTFAP